MRYILCSIFLVAGLTFCEAVPVINVFTVSDGITTSDTGIQAAPGAELTLTWDVSDAASVLILPGVGPSPLSGSAQVTFDGSTTTYFLNANGGGFVQGSLTITVDPSSVNPSLSEVLANPDRDSLLDEDGDTSDWIELGNDFSFEMEVGGYYLTDDPEMLTKWEIPAGTTIADSGELLIFASGKNRNTGGQELHTNFKLNSDEDQILLVSADGMTVVNQFTWTSENAHPGGKSYGRFGEPGQEGFFSVATPDAPNVLPFFTPEKVIFSEVSRTFNGELELAMSSSVAGLGIRYTTDRSEPDENSPLYSAPLTLSETTMVRARLLTADTIGDVSGRHYLKLSDGQIPIDAEAGADTLAEFSSNLPIIILDNVGSGAEQEGSLSATTFTLIEPENGVAKLTDVPSLTSRAGFRIRGASSANFAKKQYRLELWNQENMDKDQAVLGLPSDSDFVLGAPFVDKSFIRNSLTYELGRELGLEAPRTRHVEVFINTNGGELDYGFDYVGVYFLAETNKISNDRIDIEKLDPEDESEPEITGGYLMKWEGGAKTASKVLPGWTGLELADPDQITGATAAQKQWISDYVRDVDDRIASEDRGDPVLGYAPVLDVPSYVNLFVINELSRDQDGYMRSAYFYKERGQPLTHGPLWDYNLTMGTGCCRNNRNTSPGAGDSGWQYIENDGKNEGHWEVELMEEPNFKQAFVDRWQEVREGVLDETALNARIDEQAAPLAEAAVRNFRKWNNLENTNATFFFSPATTTWEGQIDFLKTWNADRMAWIDSQMTIPPSMSPESGLVAMGSTASVTGLEGTIYYTTDGSDPRLSGGDVNPDALIFVGTGLQDVTLVTRADTWSYLDDGSDQGNSDTVSTSTHWTHPDYDDSSWGAGEAPLGYSNGVTTTLNFGGNFSDRHITTYFRKEFTVAQVSEFLELELEIQYDDGALVYLNGVLQGRFNMADGVVHFDLVSIDGRSGIAETAWETLTLNPADLIEGENVIAIELHQERAGSSDLSFDFSLTARKSAGNPPQIPINGTTIVTARALVGEDWSGPQSELYIVGAAANTENLVVTELNYHPADPSVDEMNEGFLDQDDFEFIEMMNISTETIDLSGAHFSEGIDFAFPLGKMLAPGQRTLVVKNSAAIQERYPTVLISAIAGEFQNDSGLKNSSERVTLLSAADEVIFSIKYSDKSPWPESADGAGASLTLIDPFSNPDPGQGTQWRSSAHGGSPAATDATIFSGGNAEALLSYATGGVEPEISVLEDGTIELRFTLNLLADDLEGTFQMSPEMASWSGGSTLFFRESLTEIGGGLGVLTLRSNTPLVDEGLFFRYHISKR